MLISNWTPITRVLSSVGQILSSPESKLATKIFRALLPTSNLIMPKQL